MIQYHGGAEGKGTADTLHLNVLFFHREDSQSLNPAPLTWHPVGNRGSLTQRPGLLTWHQDDSGSILRQALAFVVPVQRNTALVGLDKALSCILQECVAANGVLTLSFSTQRHGLRK